MNKRYIQNFDAIFGENAYNETLASEAQGYEIKFLDQIYKRGYFINEDIQIMQKYQSIENLQNKIYYLKKILKKRRFHFIELFFISALMLLCIFFGVSCIALGFFEFFYGSFGESFIHFIIGVISFFIVYKFQKKYGRFFSEKEKKERIKAIKLTGGIVGALTIIGIGIK